MDEGNQTPAAGKNEPEDEIAVLQANLAEKNRDLTSRRDELLATAAKWPDVITTEEQSKELSDLLQQGRSLLKSSDARHDETKAPILAAGRAIDGWFKTGIREKIEKAFKRLAETQKNYLDKKAEEERLRRLAEADRLRREAAEKAAAAAEALRKANEAAAAEAARKAEEARRAAKPDITADPNEEPAPAPKPAAAPAPAPTPSAPPPKEVRALQADAKAAEKAAAKAETKAMAKPAEMSRVRGDRGSISSLKRFWTGKVTDRETLDLEALRQHFAMDDLEKAVRSFVAANAGEGKPAPILRGAYIWEDTRL